ncbi:MULTISPECIES: efflux RND transporter periplasmic adaptor subunit [Bacillus]|uniref:efflux RND transporter periplasmic adaptor subunit n=1 Tax=Bacillus TaxID=1386 RepID=UPI000BB6D488|nr:MULTISPECIES: efflux RND transporter periplasmic adaptor subunit [Bacillus]
MNKYWQLALLFIILMFFTACSQKEITSQSTENNKIPITVATVSEKTISNTIELTGTALPSVQVPLVTTSPLTVEKVHVRIGDTVSKGQLIVTLDSQAADEQVKQAKNAINELENALSKMKEVEKAAQNQASIADIPKLQEELNLSLQKSQSLLEGVETGAVTSLDLIQSTVDVMIKQAQLATAASQLQQIPSFNTAELEVQLQQARNGLKQAEQLADLTKITSPIDGVVADLNVVEDGIATPQLPVATIIQLNTIDATFAVNSYQVSKVKSGQKATVIFEGISEPFSSEIDIVSPTVDMQTNMFTVTIRISNTDRDILGGMRATAFVNIDELESETVVPVEAILYEENDPYVFLIEGEKAVRQNVLLGFRDDEVVQVLEGLSINDTVALNGKERLKDGVEILIQESDRD